ncbi:MAG: putative hydroxymethylpyrimidine transporter CytX [Eubacterium sp.]|nr:putative hydroxymethylpyrimidine transporter CytX [Eubacterium sp.]
MEKKKTSLFDNGLIWFGAGVSIAEILTGTFLAPLGMQKGLLAILAGHVIGGIFFFLCGLISGTTGDSAMEAAGRFYGKKGGLLFSVLNVLQLAGWTAIMIYDGSVSAAGIWSVGRWIWCIVIGGLIIVWICIGITNLGKVSLAAMIALLGLTIVLCFAIMGQGGGGVIPAEVISFGAALELSVSMPLSWLPVVGDYTREAEEPVMASLVSTIVYSLVSCWMFVIGMAAAIFAGTSDITTIMIRAGLGVAGLLIIVFSTVTTTFLDAFSAGISAETFIGKLSGKTMAVITAAAGIVCAIAFPMDDITGFLYLIGSVFAPMAAVMITDFFILKKNAENRDYDVRNLAVWLVGFILYRIFMRVDIPVGYTLPDIVITMILTVTVHRLIPFEEDKKGN